MKVDELGRELGPGVRGAAPGGAPARTRRTPQVRPFAARGRADPARRRSARSCASRAPVRATTCGRPRENLADGEPGPARVVLRAQPPLQHGRLQPGRPRGGDGRRRRPTRARRGLPVLARLGRRRTRTRCSPPPTPGAVPPHRSILATCTHALTRCNEEPARRADPRPHGTPQRPGALPVQSDQAGTDTRTPRRDGRVRAVVLRRAALPVAARSAGPCPLKPQGYRFKAQFPESPLLVTEADVRISGPQRRQGQEEDARPSAAAQSSTIEIDAKYAPMPADTRARSCGRSRCSARPTSS